MVERLVYERATDTYRVHLRRFHTPRYVPSNNMDRYFSQNQRVLKAVRIIATNDSK